LSSIRFLAATLGLILLLLLSVSVATGADSQRSLPDENFQYQLRFLWFKRVADAGLRIQHLSGGRYRAELRAETKGLLGFLTANQKNVYVSEMTFAPGKRHLVTRRFIKDVTSGGDVSRSVTDIDYEKGEYRWVATENGEIKDQGSKPIPKGVIFEDLLSAFFNLRIGAFGPLERGRRITVTSLPFYQASEDGETEYQKETIRTFEIRIADAFTEQKYRREFGRTGEKGLLVFVQVPRALFGQKSGEVLIWFDPTLLPVSARVEDVLFFGDVAGDLRLPAKSARKRGNPQKTNAK
jgi:hypothetical protein